MKRSGAVAPMYKHTIKSASKQTARPTKCPVCWRHSVVDEVCQRCKTEVPTNRRMLMI